MGGRVLSAPENVNLTAVAISRDGARIAAGAENGHVFVWQLTDAFLAQSATTLPLLHTFAAQSRSIPSLTFSPDGSVLAAASDERTLYAWRLDDGTTLWHADGTPAGGLVSADAASNVILTLGNGICVLDASKDRILQTVPLPVMPDQPPLWSQSECVSNRHASAVACSSDRIAVVGLDGSSEVVGDSTATTMQGRGGIALAPDGRRLMESLESPNQPPRLFKEADLWEWPVQAGAAPRKVAHVDSQAKALDYAADGTLVAGVTFAGSPLRVWDVATGAPRGAWGPPVSASSNQDGLAPTVAISDDGCWVAGVGEVKPQLLLVALPAGPARQIPLTEGATRHDSITFSPDGQLVGVSSSEPGITAAGALNAGGIIVRTGDGMPLRSLPGNTSRIAFLSNRVLLRDEDDGTISFWCVP